MWGSRGPRRRRDRLWRDDHRLGKRHRARDPHGSTHGHRIRDEQAHRTGAPILRPLLFEYPDDETTYSTDDEFLLGSALLVAPIARPGTEYRHVYLPRGTWVHYWTGERSVGPAHVLAHAPLGQPAIYVRANTAVPLWPEMSNTDERAPDPLTWLVFPAVSEDGLGELYDDAGEGFAYEGGDFARWSW